METLDLTALKVLAPQIIELLDRINAIDPDREKSIVAYELNDNSIGIKTETWYSGCGTDSNTTTVYFEELEKPFSYFEERFSKRIQQKEEEKKKREANQKKEKEDADRKKYEELKEKFG